MLRAVIDINIILASIGFNSPYRWIIDCIYEGKITLFISNDILFEYLEVLEFKTSPQFSENFVEFIVANPNIKKIDVYYNFLVITNDFDDNKYVDCAVTCNADCLVSNDSHFKVLKDIPFPKVNHLTLQQFEAKYKKLLTKS